MLLTANSRRRGAADRLKRQKSQTGGNNMVGYCVQRNRGWHEVIRCVGRVREGEPCGVLCTQCCWHLQPSRAHLAPHTPRDTRGTCEANSLTATYKDIRELQTLTQRLLDKLSIFPSQ